MLLEAEKRDEISLGEVEGFAAQLENLPILANPMTLHQAFSRTLALARGYRLSCYNAAYLELATREGVPVATLDKNLQKAATRADVGLHLRS